MSHHRSSEEMREVAWEIDESEAIAEIIPTNNQETRPNHDAIPTTSQKTINNSTLNPTSKDPSAQMAPNALPIKQTPPSRSDIGSMKSTVSSSVPAHPPQVHSAQTNSDNPTLSKQSRFLGVPAPRSKLTGSLQSVISVSGIEGKWSILNDLSKENKVRAIIHTGNFGFYDDESYSTMSIAAIKTFLRRRDPLRSVDVSEDELRKMIREYGPLSELQEYIQGVRQFAIPVYVIWGQNEDVKVIEKFRKGVYHVPNLYLLDHRNSYAISTGHVTLRLFGLGGSFNYHKLFDVGKGTVDIVCGGDGGIWANFIQLGELLEMADRYTDSKELRIFVTQANPLNEPLAHILGTNLRADFTISPGEASFAIAEDAIIFRNTRILTKYLQPTREDLISMWDQIYFACTEAFTDLQRKSGQRLIAALKKDPLPFEACKSLIHISLFPIRFGEVVFVLGEDGINLEMTFSYRKSLKSTTSTTSFQESSTISPRTNLPSSLCIQDVRYEAPASQTTKPLNAAEQSAMAPPQTSRNSLNGIARTEELSSNMDRAESKPTETRANQSRSESTSAVLDSRTDSNDGLSSLVLRNLPYNISGKELDEQLFSHFDIAEIEFISPKNDVALVKFTREEEMFRALASIRNAKLNGRDVRASPSGRSRQTQDDVRTASPSLVQLAKEAMKPTLPEIPTSQGTSTLQESTTPSQANVTPSQEKLLQAPNNEGPSWTIETKASVENAKVSRTTQNPTSSTTARIENLSWDCE